jgi:hypothetical protein
MQQHQWLAAAAAMHGDVGGVQRLDGAGHGFGIAYVKESAGKLI